MQHINDLDACKKAVSQLEDNYPGVIFDGYSNRGYPPGCFLFAKKYVYFNANSGSKNRRAQHICKTRNYIKYVFNLNIFKNEILIVLEIMQSFFYFRLASNVPMSLEQQQRKDMESRIAHNTYH